MIYHTITEYMQAKNHYEQQPATIQGTQIIVNGKAYDPKEYHAVNTKPRYEVAPKANPDGTRIVSGIKPRMKKAKVALLVAMIFLMVTTQAQVYTQFAATFTNQYLGGDLQVGLRAKQTFISFGYTAMLHNTQPALFNVRAGAIISDMVLIYGGYVRNHMSNDYKWKNFNTWQAGGQYHFLHYDKGTFYIIGNYTHPARITAGIGMSYNLIN